MGTWIAVGIVLFVLGSIMGLKPSSIDVRLDKLRMKARKLELNPKLVACPSWIRGKNHEFGKGMIGQYGIIIEGMKLPHVRYDMIDGEWRIEKIDGEGNFSLDKAALDLPKSIELQVKALEAKANSIQVYWHDIAYVRPATNSKFNIDNIDGDLLALKSKLVEWAKKIESSI